jgi:hypothetical protein
MKESVYICAGARRDSGGTLGRCKAVTETTGDTSLRPPPRKTAKNNLTRIYYPIRHHYCSTRHTGSLSCLGTSGAP